MGLLLLKTNDCNLIYEFNKGTILSIQVIKLEKRPKKAVIQPLKVVLVEITPSNYKITMNYYGDAPVPILKCESDQTEWIKEE